MSNKNYVNFVSPKGTAKYPRLDQPYAWSNAQNRSVPDPEGQFELVVVMSESEAASMKKALKEAVEKSGIKPQNTPIKKEIDKDTGEPTGNVEIKMKAYGKRKDGSPNAIRFFDAKARPMPSNFRLTSGSVVRAEGYISVAKLGARFNLRSVQVIDLAEQASTFAVEDGYEYDGEEEINNITTETTVGNVASNPDDEDFDF